MPYRPTPERLKELNMTYIVKLVVSERKKTGWIYELRWWDGKTQRRKSLKTQDFSAAGKARDRFEAGLTSIKRIDANIGSGIPLSDFRQAYLEYCRSRQLSPETIKTASWMLNALVRFLEDIELSLVTPDMIDNYVTGQLSRGRKPRGVINKEELHNKEDRAITLTLVLTGIRIGELLSLKWSNVNLNDGFIIVKGKGGHERIVLIGSLLREVLKDLPKYDETDLVFPGFRYHGKKLAVHGKKSYSPLRTRFSRYFEQAGIEKDRGTFHRLRHTVGSTLGDKGYTSLQISKLLGHTSERTIKIYTTISELPMIRVCL